MASLAYTFDEPATPLNPLELPVHDAGSDRERRQAPRLSATFIVRPRTSEAAYRGLDLSFGGLMCIGEEPLWPGNEIGFDLVLPGDARPVSVSGRVVELVGYRGDIAMRVRFEQIGIAERKRIAAWMSRAQL